MTDSTDEAGLAAGRSLLYRGIEGLTVLAFIGAIAVWQLDGTLDAARRLVMSFGREDPPPAPRPFLIADPGASDIRLVTARNVDPQAPAKSEPPAKNQARAKPTADPSAELDPVETGSITAPPAAGPAAVARLDAAIPSAPRREVAASPPPSGWIASCDDHKPALCTASQSLARPDDPSLETSWTIESGEGGLVGVWTTPTSVVVSRGMVLTLGDGKPKTVPFESCGPHSCEVRARLAADFIGLLRDSSRISTEFVMRGGKTVTFTFSKAGLTEALKTIGAG